MGGHPDPEKRGGGPCLKKIFWGAGRQFGLRIVGGGGPPLDSPLCERYLIFLKVIRDELLLLMLPGQPLCYWT